MPLSGSELQIFHLVGHRGSAAVIMSIIIVPLSVCGTPIQLCVYPRPLLGLKDHRLLPSLPGKKIFSYNFTVWVLRFLLFFIFFYLLFSGNTYFLSRVAGSIFNLVSPDSGPALSYKSTSHLQEGEDPSLCAHPISSSSLGMLMLIFLESAF